MFALEVFTGSRRAKKCYLQSRHEVASSHSHMMCIMRVLGSDNI